MTLGRWNRADLSIIVLTILGSTWSPYIRQKFTQETYIHRTITIRQTNKEYGGYPEVVSRS